MAQERISRSRKRELEQPDEFITLSSRMVGFASAHAKQMTTGLVVLLVLVVVISGFRYYSIQTEKKAGAKLGKILGELEKAREDQKPEDVLQSLKPEFEGMMADFPRKKATKAARLFYAALAFQAKDSDTALKLYEQSLEDFPNDPFYKNLVLKNLATLYEEKKDYEKAALYLDKALKEPEPEMKDEMLFNRARLLGASHMKDRELEDYKKIIAEFPDSEYAKISATKLK